MWPRQNSFNTDTITSMAWKLIPWYGQVLPFKIFIWFWNCFHFSSFMELGRLGWSSITLSESVTQKMTQILNHCGFDWESYERHLLKKRTLKFPQSQPQTRLPSTITRSIANRYAATLWHRRYRQSKGMINQQRRIRVIRWLIFCTLRLWQRIRSKTLASTHSMKLRSYWFHPIFCLHLWSRSPLKLPSQKPRIAFHVVGASSM